MRAGLPAGLHGIGVDLVSVERLERFLRENPAGLDQLFTAAERGAVPHAGQLAEAFALKEAAMKAIGGLSGWELDWREIERVPRRNAVEIRLAGKVKAHAKKLGVGPLRASVSRMGGKVLATVLATSLATVSAESTSAP